MAKARLRREHAEAERLEWYGDAVLEQLVSRLLLRCLRPTPTPDRVLVAADQQMSDILAGCHLLPQPTRRRARAGGSGSAAATTGGRCCSVRDVRDALLCNTNLARAHDALQLVLNRGSGGGGHFDSFGAGVAAGPAGGSRAARKAKADALETAAGRLSLLLAEGDELQQSRLRGSSSSSSAGSTWSGRGRGGRGSSVERQLDALVAAVLHSAWDVTAGRGGGGGGSGEAPAAGAAAAAAAAVAAADYPPGEAFAAPPASRGSAKRRRLRHLYEAPGAASSFLQPVAGGGTLTRCAPSDLGGGSSFDGGLNPFNSDVASTTDDSSSEGEGGVAGGGGGEEEGRGAGEDGHETDASDVWREAMEAEEEEEEQEEEGGEDSFDEDASMGSSSSSSSSAAAASRASIEASYRLLPPVRRMLAAVRGGGVRPTAAEGSQGGQGCDGGGGGDSGDSDETLFGGGGAPAIELLVRLGAALLAERVSFSLLRRRRRDGVGGGGGDGGKSGGGDRWEYPTAGALTTARQRALRFGARARVAREVLVAGGVVQRYAAASVASRQPGAAEHAIFRAMTTAATGEGEGSLVRSLYVAIALDATSGDGGGGGGGSSSSSSSSSSSTGAVSKAVKRGFGISGGNIRQGNTGRAPALLLQSVAAALCEQSEWESPTPAAAVDDAPAFEFQSLDDDGAGGRSGGVAGAGGAGGAGGCLLLEPPPGLVTLRELPRAAAAAQALLLPGRHGSGAAADGRAGMAGLLPLATPPPSCPPSPLPHELAMAMGGIGHARRRKRPLAQISTMAPTAPLCATARRLAHLSTAAGRGAVPLLLRLAGRKSSDDDGAGGGVLEALERLLTAFVLATTVGGAAGVAAAGTAVVATAGGDRSSSSSLFFLDRGMESRESSAAAPLPPAAAPPSPPTPSALGAGTPAEEELCPVQRAVVAAVRRAQDDGDGSGGSGGGCIVSEVAAPGVICGGVAAVSIVACVRRGHERSRGDDGAENDDGGTAAVAVMGSAGSVAGPEGEAAGTLPQQQLQRRRLLLLLPSADPLHRLLLHHLCCCHGVHAFGVRVRRRGNDAVGVAEVVTAGPAGSGGKERAVAVLSPPEPCRTAADGGHLTAATSNSSRRAAALHSLPLHHLYAANRAPVCAFLAQQSS